MIVFFPFKYVKRQLGEVKIEFTYEVDDSIYLGVNKDELQNMKAHAWIRCGEMIVTGQYEKDHFIQVANFSNEKLI